MRIATLLTAAFLAPSPALACGGLFCSNVQQPVDQAGEKILFAVDEAKGTIEVQVQIAYTGPAEQFAWILPVPAQPTLSTSVDDVLRVLGDSTFPLWQLTFEQKGQCKEDLSLVRFETAIGSVVVEDAVTNGDGGGVTVGSEGPVGPYETAVIQADTVEDLVSWLASRDYYLPDVTAERLAPYVGQGAWVAALRLQKDKSAGDLVPIQLTYPGSEPQIPLYLTSVAAVDDMPLQPFVLGSARAVPENYLHVTVNPFAVDWVGAGANYADVVRRAADEAGGQAFATDFAGATSALAGQFWSSNRYDVGFLRQLGVADASTAIQQMGAAGFPVSPGTAPILRDLITPSIDPFVAQSGQTEVAFLACIQCFTTTSFTLDAAALADELEASWIPAMKHAQELVDGLPYVTRLTSSVSPDEMTVDPLFVLNPDMPDVPRTRDATLVTHCAPAVSRGNANRSLELADGRSLWMPAEIVFASNEDRAAWLADNTGPAAQTVEQTFRSGDAALTLDQTAALDEALQDTRAMVRCGCATGGEPAGGALAFSALLLGLVRRRRSPSGV